MTRHLISILIASQALVTVGQAEIAQTHNLINQRVEAFELNSVTSGSNFELLLSPGEELMLQITSSAEVAVQISDASGNLIPIEQLEIVDARQAEPVPLGAISAPGMYQVLYRNDDYEPGNWTISVSLPDGVKSASGIIRSTVQGGLAVAMTSSRPVYTLLSLKPVVLTVIALNNGQPEPGLDVFVDVLDADDPGRIVGSLRLYDDGVAPDLEAGDGLYTGERVFDDPLRAIAQARIVSPQHELYASTSFDVGEVGYIWSVSDYYENYIYGPFKTKVRIRTSVRVPDESGWWRIDACLTASNDATICRREERYVSYDPHTLDFYVEFEASEIIETLAVDGRYDMTARLYKINEAGDTYSEFIDQQTRASNPYRVAGDGTGYFDLFHGRYRLLPGIVSEALVDLDDDGKFDVLDIGARFECLSRCRGMVIATIMDPNGNLITSSPSFPDINIRDPGIYTYNLRVSTRYMGHFAINGPYRIVSLTFTDYYPGEPGTYLQELGTTEFYPYTIFKYSPDGVDADFDGTLNTDDNCIDAYNPEQFDSNKDGFGNACDPDFNNDLIVNFADLMIMHDVFFEADADADLNTDGLVNFGDLQMMAPYMFQPPGPSAFHP